jgi:hypothetical protein
VKTALLVIATGARYHKYLQPLLASARTYFVPHTPVIFSDTSDIGFGEHPYMVVPHEEWPGPTLHRYHTFLKAREYLSIFDQIFYADVDMLFVAPVGEEIFSNGITATIHPGFVGGCGTPERRPESMAAIAPGSQNKYFCGGFNGGASEKFMAMAMELAWRVDQDRKKHIVAVWHDESHLNRYLYDSPPAKILDPSYCYPENADTSYTGLWSANRLTITPKLLALTKPKLDFPR